MEYQRVNKLIQAPGQPATHSVVLPRRAAAEAGAKKELPAVVRDAVSSAGVALEPGVRTLMESSFGHNFSRVRVHADAQAAESARALGARGYTVGRDIVFGGNRYQPGNISGRLLLAHELAHVAQQERAPEGASMMREGSARSSEDEARRLAVGAVGGHRVQVGGHAGAPALQLSQLSDDLDLEFSSAGVKGVIDILRANCPLPARDSDVETWIMTNLGGDDLWLASKIYEKGPEALWGAADYNERFRRARVNQWAPEPGGIEGTIGTSSGLVSKPMPIKAFFFPGETDERALIIGGVHGSELAGVEVANRLVASLRLRFDMLGQMPYYTTIIVPELFPESVAKARARPSTLKNKASNVGRQIVVPTSKPVEKKGKTFTTKELQPARQFPIPGESLSDLRAKGVSKNAKGDRLKDEMEGLDVPLMSETIALLELIERFKPSRIASVHSKRLPDTVKRGENAPGVFADPRGGVDKDRKSLTAEGQADDALALAIAAEAQKGGANVPGNWLGTSEQEPHYPNEDKPKGFSLGDWAPVEVKGTGPGARKGITTITVEVQHYYDSSQDPSGARAKELQAHADALEKIFLETK